MWCMWSTVLLVSCTLVHSSEVASTTELPVSAATPRPPPRTLDRKAAELAWRTWLLSPESGSADAPPRRITTKSLFITPLMCPKGQRLDRNGCVQVVTVSKDDHERILLEQLNTIFTSSAPNGDIVYDYGDEEKEPLQLSIPIGLDPQASPLQGSELSLQAQDLNPDCITNDKRDETNPNGDPGIVAELELLKLAISNNNKTALLDHTNILSHNFLPSDKPKRDSPQINETKITTDNSTKDEGQKEIVYGHVNVDPILYDTEYKHEQQSHLVTNTETVKQNLTAQNVQNNTTFQIDNNNKVLSNSSLVQNASLAGLNTNLNTQTLTKVEEQSKLNPENEYPDNSKAIKLISRYADVTTDDNFTKDRRKYDGAEDSILGTRTKPQHRHKLPNIPGMLKESLQTPATAEITKNAFNPIIPKRDGYYRYPWMSQNIQTRPPGYPFRHLQDYWSGRPPFRGLYNTDHENPTRHHHAYPQTYHQFRGYYPRYSDRSPALQKIYGDQFHGYLRREVPYSANAGSANNNQDLYSLLGLRHWFSNEGTSNR